MRLRFVLSLIILWIFITPPRAASAQGPLAVPLLPTPLAQANGLGEVTGSAVVDIDGGWLTITMKLPNGYKVPNKSAFEGWLADLGALQPPLNHASNGDQKFGPSYANRTLAAMTNAIPYWLTAGALLPNNDGTYSV